MKKIFQIILSLLLFFIFVDSYSQDQAKKDSLIRLIDVEDQDTSKVILYEKLARLYLKTNIDSALVFATKGLYLAEKKNYTYGIGKIYRILGHAMVVNDNLEKAKEYYLNALEQFTIDNKVVSQASIYLVLGNVYYVQNNLPEALNYYIMGERISDSLNLVDLLPHFYNNLAGIYLQLEDYPHTLEYFENALKISELNGDSETSINILTNLAEADYKSNNFDRANMHLEQALQLTEKLSPNKEYKIHIYKVKGEIEIELKNFEKALNYYNNSLELINEMGPGYLGPISIYKADCRIRAGVCYFNLGKYNEAIENLNIGYKLAEESGLVSLQRDAVLYLSEINDSLGNDKTAFSYFKTYKTLYDSIINENTTKKMTQLRMQFEFDKKMKEQEINRIKNEANQKRKEIILFVIIGGILVILIIFILLFLLQKNKSKRIYLERKNLELDLDSRNKELTTNVMYLLKKNEFIESISDKLKKAKLYFKPENRAFIDNIVKELESSSTKDTWEEFEVRFQQVHSDFYKKLTDQYPDLSPNDLKLCAFLRLNMSTKEISAITYQSLNTLSTARYRLRKKLGLDDHANLIAFLSQL